MMMMKLHQIPRNLAVATTMRRELHSRASPNYSRGISSLEQCDRTFISEFHDQRWALARPDVKIHQITLSEQQVYSGEGTSLRFTFSNNTRPCMGEEMKERQDPSFFVVRDDLLHPLVNGNKARKLDGLLPLVEDHLVTDVVTCGGCQSAHAAAVGREFMLQLKVYSLFSSLAFFFSSMRHELTFDDCLACRAAVSCAERGLRSHLLLRGEQPDIPTGYNLISTMYGNVIYVPRSLYAKREEMLSRHADLVAGNNGSVIWFSDILLKSFAIQKTEEERSVTIDSTSSSRMMTRSEKYPKKVVIINEGAGDFAALLGVIRLVEYLSQTHIFGKEQPLKIVVDSGTGTTAVGLALGSLCFGLPWEITAVMLADTIEGYTKQEKRLIFDFKRYYSSQKVDDTLNGVEDGIVHWVERINPRKFGNVLKGEIETCQEIAQQTGILLDPVYTLAAWEQATNLCQGEAKKVVMLHTGGTLGMFGLAQRYKSFFHTLEKTMPNVSPEDGR